MWLAYRMAAFRRGSLPKAFHIRVNFRQIHLPQGALEMNYVTETSTSLRTYSIARVQGIS